MTDARAAMLRRMRSALGRGAPPDPATVAAEAAAALPDVSVTQPALRLQDPVAEFIAKATSERLAATVEEIESEADAPDAVRRYLAAEGAPTTLALPPDPSLRTLDWSGLEIRETLDANEETALGRADWAIAETGSLVLRSSPEQPTLYAFLPLRHVVLAPRANVVRHMEDFWRAFRATGDAHPRNINFVTGVSGTADIESKLVRGAHGPRYLHILLVGGAGGEDA